MNLSFTSCENLATTLLQFLTKNIDFHGWTYVLPKTVATITNTGQYAHIWDSNQKMSNFVPNFVGKSNLQIFVKRQKIHKS